MLLVRMARTLGATLLLLPPPATPAPPVDCNDKYFTKTSCDADDACSWCISPSIPGNRHCNTLADARALPTSVFTCDKLFDPSEAELMVKVADAAYCGDSNHPAGGAGGRSIVDWSCPACEAARTHTAGATGGGPGALSDVAIFEDRSRQTFGFVGVSDGWPAASTQAAEAGFNGTSEQRIVVSFRGSVLLFNFLDDVRGALVPHPRGGRVHEGCYGSFKSMASQMMKRLDTLRAKHPKVNRIMVTGHSLGATQSVYGAEEIALAYPDAQVHLYSFGTMRPGDARYATRVGSIANLRTTPVAHRADPVPQRGNGTKDRGEGYQQIGGNVWYHDDLPLPSTAWQQRRQRRRQQQVGDWREHWVECDGTGEDPLCQDSLPVSVLHGPDHDLYIGHAMWCCNGTRWANASQTSPAPAGCVFPFPPPPVSRQRRSRGQQ
jgi:hypothetical protein